MRSSTERRTFKLLVEEPPNSDRRDRRYPGDRRKTCCRAYFMQGGQERRSWGERRYRWDMTR